MTGLLDIDEDGHADPPTTAETLQSLRLLVIALLVLAPESISAVRNAARDRVQTSLNLAYGSAMASIGLTIPTITVAMTWLEGPLALGLEPMQIVLLSLSVVVARSPWRRPASTPSRESVTWCCSRRSSSCRSSPRVSG